jgi:hypothetical protein
VADARLRCVAPIARVDEGEGIVTDTEQSMSDADGKAAAPHEWEPMSLTKIGTFGEVLRGNTGPKGDGGGSMQMA